MEFRRALCILRWNFLIDSYILYPWSYLQKIMTTINYRITKRVLFEKKVILYFILGNFKEKATVSLHIGKNRSQKWTEILSR